MLHLIKRILLVIIILFSIVFDLFINFLNWDTIQSQWKRNHICSMRNRCNVSTPFEKTNKNPLDLILVHTYWQNYFALNVQHDQTVVCQSNECRVTLFYSWHSTCQSNECRVTLFCPWTLTSDMITDLEK